MKMLFITGVIALIASQAFAQTPDSMPPSTRSTAGVEASLATPTGHEVNVGVGGYNYRRARRYEHFDPRRQVRRRIYGHDVTQQAPALVSPGRCAGPRWQHHVRWLVFALPDHARQHVAKWLRAGCWRSVAVQRERRQGLVSWKAAPSSARISSADKWGWSPDIGLGIRHLSNGTTGVAGYRTDDYLYLPVGITARTSVASHNALSFNLEYDPCCMAGKRPATRNWAVGMFQRHRQRPRSRSMDFPISRSLSTRGWALRASAKYPVTRHWSVEPSTSTGTSAPRR